MEVVKHLKEGVEEVLEEAASLRRRLRHPRRHSSSCSSSSANDDDSADVKPVTETEWLNEEHEEDNEKSVFFYKNEGTTQIEWSLLANSLEVDDLSEQLKNVDFQKLLKAFIQGQAEKNITLPESDLPREGQITDWTPLNQVGTETVNTDPIEETEEEVTELEFAVEKIHTHNVYCPNCKSGITKVILRKRTRVQPIPPPVNTPDPEPVGLLGCLSCLSIFIPRGSSCNPFIGKRREPEQSQIPQQTPEADPIISSSHVVDDQSVKKQGECFSLLWIFGKKKEEESAPISQPTSSEQVPSDLPTKPQEPGKYPEAYPPEGSKQPEVIIDVEEKPEDSVPLPPIQELPVESGPRQGSQGDDDVARPIHPPERQSSKSVEIIKSIVYGGLVESITSLSVVSSAAASDGTTSSIIAMGLANLIGGLFIIVNNLRDLKNARSGEVSNLTSEQRDEYQETLGRRENFLLHATFAVLSFLVFGLISPVTYGFSFRESNDKDFKLLAVLAASLLCVTVLAIGKAYIRRPPKFYMYIGTALYYVATAVVVSGASYGAGDLIKKLLDKLGLFESSAAANMLLPGTSSVNPAWACH